MAGRGSSAAHATAALRQSPIAGIMLFIPPLLLNHLITDEGEVIDIAPAVHREAAAIALEIGQRANKSIAEGHDLESGIAQPRAVVSGLTQECEVLAVGRYVGR